MQHPVITKKLFRGIYYFLFLSLMLSIVEGSVADRNVFSGLIRSLSPWFLQSVNVLVKRFWLRWKIWTMTGNRKEIRLQTKNCGFQRSKLKEVIEVNKWKEQKIYHYLSFNDIFHQKSSTVMFFSATKSWLLAPSHDNKTSL